MTKPMACRTCLAVTVRNAPMPNYILKNNKDNKLVSWCFDLSPVSHTGLYQGYKDTKTRELLFMANIVFLCIKIYTRATKIPKLESYFSSRIYFFMYKNIHPYIYIYV